MHIIEHFLWTTASNLFTSEKKEKNEIKINVTSSQFLASAVLNYY